MALVLAITASMASPAVIQAADTMPWTGDKAIGDNQAHVVGQRIKDLKYWEPGSEDDAELLRAQVPLQGRIDTFAATQANPDLATDAEIFNMQGDYGNSFFEATTHNNAFAPYTFNYWQYTDYYASWHGVTTKGVPENLYDPDGYWGDRAFEFGLINMPNPAYTNAAHKNGSKSIGCIFLPRTGQTHRELLEKDENGEFPIAKKLIEFANYYGFDGYFINQEETIPSEDVEPYKEFTKYLIDHGMWIQWYDSITPSGGLSYQNELNASNATFIHDDAYGLGKVNSSLFVNYDWFRTSGGQIKAEKSLQYAADNGIDPFTEVFFGVEANQGKLSGSHGSAKNVDYIYEPGTKNLRGSVALFTPSDWIQRGLEDDIGVKGAENDSGYYWMIAERERMYYSGVAQDPTNTGKMSGYENSDIGVSNASGWVGVADFASERSVIGGTTFYTNFNTGHGMEYYQDGQVLNENEWANMNIQDILPTWQWWIDAEGTKLNVDYDYGEKYQRLDKSGADIGTEYQKVGAYKGGSSLVVSGDLDAENFLHLYKTDLSVNDNTKVSITYNKASADDASKMEVGVIFKNDPDTVVTFNVPQANKQTDGWVTKQISLGDYAGEEIAAIGLNFDNGSGTIADYQMNIGELKVTDGSVAKPATPENFHVENAYDTKEMVVGWDLADYSEVQQYNVYANLSDGSRVYLGGTYDDTYYIKSLYDEKDIVTLELTAVNEEGVESDPATVAYQYSDKVSNIVVDETETENGNKVQATNAGYLDVSWTNPTGDYEGLELTVTPVGFFNYEKRDLEYTMTVGKDVSSARIMTPIADGSEYTLAIRTIFADGSKSEPIEYTGYFKDVYCDPYDGGLDISSRRTELKTPKAEDWWHMYATVNGKTTTYIRGKTALNISVSGSGVIEVVLEDYSGNMSDPVYIPYGDQESGEIDETMFPDAALLQAVKEQIGTTTQEISVYSGSLDLSGTEVKDLTGLDLIANLSSLNLTGCTGLTNVEIKGMQQLKEIDITGCTELQSLKINDTGVETLVSGEASEYAGLLILDLSGNRFDMTPGTPERNFVDAIEEQIANYDGPAITQPVSGNVAVNGSITPDTVDDWNTNFVNPGNIIDGDTVSEASASGTIGAYITVDLGAPMPINKWAAYLGGVNGSNCYPSAFSIWYSNDNTEFTQLEAITQKTNYVEKSLADPVTAQYWKIQLDGRASWSSIITELELYADSEIEIEPSVKYDNQKPLLYPGIEEILRIDANNNGKPLDMNAYYEDCLANPATVRGTSVEALQGADFLAADYNADEALINPNVDLIIVTDEEGNVVSDNIIDTTTAGEYTVEYITYHDGVIGGTVVTTQKVYVRGITTVLEKIIANAEKLMENGALDNTMEAVVEEFNAALAHAKEIVAKDGATQQEINDATERLLKVMGKVDWKQGDKTVLEVTVDIANAIKPDLDLYVEAGKQEFLDALAVAESLLESGNAWQEEIDKAADDLMEAMSNLRMKPNKDILNDMINKAEGTDLSGYTEDSVAALNAALANAQTVAADENASQDEVDAAADSLKAAMSGLVFVDGDHNNEANTDDTTADNTTTTPVGDGTTPTKTGDAGVAGIASLAVLSAACALVVLKKKQR